MVEIITDSSALNTLQEAEQAGFHSVPLNIIFGNESFKDLEDITPQEFRSKVAGGVFPKSSQPTIGEKLELYNKLLNNDSVEIIDITIMSGISGAYQSALLAKEQCKDPERVYLIDSRTLCGPQEELVKKAVQMRDEGSTAKEIVDYLTSKTGTDIGAVICPDMGYLERGGRVPKVVGMAGSLLKIMPIVKKDIDADILGILSASRTFKKGVQAVIKYFQDNGVAKDWVLYVTHGDNEKEALKAKDAFEQSFPGMKIIVKQISTLFMVHGGPGCLAIQAIQI